jgi:HEAT repeat protein
MRKLAVVVVGSLVFFVCADGIALQTSKDKPKDDPRGKVVTEAEVREKLKVLDAPGNGKFGALGWFETALPPNDEIKAIVARKLIVLLTDNDNAVVNGGAARAMLNWATEEIAPKLMVVAVSENNSGYTVMALGMLKYEKAIPLIIRRLEAVKDRINCGKALVKMGPVAEPAVIKLLTAKRGEVVTEACRVLGQIGTKASLPALEKLSQGANKSHALAADNAIAAIKDREISSDKK